MFVQEWKLIHGLLPRFMWIYSKEWRNIMQDKKKQHGCNVAGILNRHWKVKPTEFFSPLTSYSDEEPRKSSNVFDVRKIQWLICWTHWSETRHFWDFCTAWRNGLRCLCQSPSGRVHLVGPGVFRAIAGSCEEVYGPEICTWAELGTGLQRIWAPA